MVLFSIWMLNQWSHHIPVPPPVAPSPEPPHIFNLNFGAVRVSDHMIPFNLASHMVSGSDDAFGLKSVKLPAPWFIYSFMAVGILVCCITCIGHIAAESINGCCLCFYVMLKTILILLEAVFVAFVAFDRHWEKDLPFDQTGELDSLRSFIEDNADICKWVGISLIIIQVLSMILAFVLRSMVSSGRGDHECEDDYDVESRSREPLLYPQSGQTSASTKAAGRNTYSDIWSSRVREKYGMNSGGDAKYDLPNSNMKSS